MKSSDMFMKTMGFLETYRLLYLISLRAGAPCVIGVRAWMRVDATFTVMRQLFRGSFALGMASNGRLIPVMGNVITVPAFIPNGSLVSVTEIDR